jgi:beta-xylosidase
MHSRDLVNWKLAGYCMERLDLGPAFRLEGGNIYIRGIWAPCIRSHRGMFYIFSNVNGVGLQVFRSRSIYGVLSGKSNEAQTFGVPLFASLSVSSMGKRKPRPSAVF